MMTTSKFFALLIDSNTGQVNYNYPSELYATSKEHAKKLLLENIPPESLYNILTEAEFLKMMGVNNDTTDSNQNIPEIEENRKFIYGLYDSFGYCFCKTYRRIRTNN